MLLVLICYFPSFFWGYGCSKKNQIWFQPKKIYFLFLHSRLDILNRRGIVCVRLDRQLLLQRFSRLRHHFDRQLRCFTQCSVCRPFSNTLQVSLFRRIFLRILIFRPAQRNGTLFYPNVWPHRCCNWWQRNRSINCQLLSLNFVLLQCRIIAG